jgi:hypothetical protein
MIMVHEPGIGGYKLRPSPMQSTIPTPPQTPLSSPSSRRQIKYDSNSNSNNMMTSPPNHATQLPPLFQPSQQLPSLSSFSDHHLSRRVLPPPTLDISDNAISTNSMTNYDRSLCKEFNRL